MFQVTHLKRKILHMQQQKRQMGDARYVDSPGLIYWQEVAAGREYASSKLPSRLSPLSRLWRRSSYRSWSSSTTAVGKWRWRSSYSLRNHLKVNSRVVSKVLNLSNPIPTSNIWEWGNKIELTDIMLQNIPLHLVVNSFIWNFKSCCWGME